MNSIAAVTSAGIDRQRAAETPRPPPLADSRAGGRARAGSAAAPRPATPRRRDAAARRHASALEIGRAQRRAHLRRLARGRRADGAGKTGLDARDGSVPPRQPVAHLVERVLQRRAFVAERAGRSLRERDQAFDERVLRLRGRRHRRARATGRDEADCEMERNGAATRHCRHSRRGGLSAPGFRLPAKKESGLGFPKPASVPPQPRSPEPGARSPQKSSDALILKIRGTSTAVGAGHVALNSVP